NANFGDRLKYAGGDYDTTTGLEHFGDRYYDPAARRWTSQDPIGFSAGDANLYRYAGNNTPNATDPSTKRFFRLMSLIMRRYGSGAGRPRGVRASTKRRLSNQGRRWPAALNASSTGTSASWPANGSHCTSNVVGVPYSRPGRLMNVRRSVRT